MRRFEAVMDETLEQAFLRIFFDASLKYDKLKWDALCNWAEEHGIVLVPPIGAS